ncbi:MAG: integrase [Dehalococcoidia bacterium]|nr:MAG: integrase [Dehalococcoidia bacterium]
MKAYLEIADVTKLTEAAGNTRDKLLIRLLFHLGCRVSEALSIEIKDIDFTSGTVTIRHLKCRSRLFCPSCKTRLGRAHQYCPKCGKMVTEAEKVKQEEKRYRVVPLDGETLNLFKKYVKKGGLVIKNDKELLFGINRGRAWQIVKECAERAGFPQLLNPTTGKMHHVSPHKLRDAFAVNAVKHDDSGDGLRMLQEHLGHQSFNTTARYRKVAGEELKRWYDGLWEEHDTGAHKA